jgi:hypothetical protein
MGRTMEGKNLTKIYCKHICKYPLAFNLHANLKNLNVDVQLFSYVPGQSKWYFLKEKDLNVIFTNVEEAGVPPSVAM